MAPSSISPRRVTFLGRGAAEKEQWAVNLQFGVNQMTVERYLGLKGSVRYLLPASTRLSWT